MCLATATMFIILESFPLTKPSNRPTEFLQQVNSQNVELILIVLTHQWASKDVAASI